MKLLSYLLFRFLVFCFSLIPFSLLYFISDVLKILLFNVFGYRRKTIEKNIQLCFQEITPSETRRIVSETYKNFVDIILEGIKGLSMDPGKLIPRYKLLGVERINEYFDSERGIFVYCQHYNNWEWGPICLGLQSKYQLVGIVKSLSNPYINDYIFKGRDGNETTIVPSNETSRFLSNNPINDKAFIFISDQLPYGHERFTNIDFLGVNTRFHTGAAHYACKLNIPVFNSVMKRVKRGYYEISLHLITDRPADLGPEELVSRYRDHLENLIKEYPPGWLWSHRRFKDVISY